MNETKDHKTTVVLDKKIVKSLISKGFNISQLVRNYLRQVDESENISINIEK